MKPCIVCLSLRRGEVNGAIVANLGDSIISEMFRTSKRSIKRHRQHLPDVLAAESRAGGRGATYNFTYAPTYNVILSADALAEVLAQIERTEDTVREGGGGYE